MLEINLLLKSTKKRNLYDISNQSKEYINRLIHNEYILKFPSSYQFKIDLAIFHKL